MGIRLLIVGATGLVGGHVLALALADKRISSITAPTRHALPIHEKLNSPIVDFENLPIDADWWAVDAVICTLGTTIRIAGSRENFHRVDHDYPLFAARLARQHGASTFVLNSALAANAKSRIFYNQVKGELEQQLTQEGFHSLTFVRPGLIGGNRKEFRVGERLFTVIFSLLAPVLPRKLRINPASKIAHELIEAAIQSPAGIHVVTSDKLV